MSSLKAKTVSGVKWQVTNKVAQKFLSVATFAVLARILEPSVFGLFAMAFILIDGLAIFQTLGIDAGIIHKQEVSQKMLSTAFYMVQAMGFVIFAICFLTAPLAGQMFKNAQVDEVIRALGIIFILSCTSRIPQTLLVKQMKFKATSMIQVACTVTNSVCAIMFALVNPTVWALVYAYLCKQLVSTILTWKYSNFRLTFEFDKESALELFHFGKFLVGSSVVWFLNNYIGMGIVGRLLGTTMLGFLALARNIGGFINTHFTQLISRVMFPAFSQMQNDPQGLKRAYLKTVKFVSIATFPFSVCLIFLAKEFALFLYGPKWIDIIPLIQLMGFMQLMGGPIIASAGSVFNAVGKPKYSYWVGVISLFVRVPAMLFFTWKWGVIGTVASNLPVNVIMIPIDLWCLQRVIKFNLKELLEQFLAPILASMVMAVMFMIARAILPGVTLLPKEALNHLVALTFYGLMGSFGFISTMFLVDRRSSFEVKNMLFKMEKA